VFDHGAQDVAIEARRERVGAPEQLCVVAGENAFDNLPVRISAIGQCSVGKQLPQCNSQAEP
jgi:hypothetical protein